MPSAVRNAGNGFMTMPEVQSLLGIRSRKTILKYISEQSLPAYKLGGTRWRFSRADVEKFLARHRTGKNGNSTRKAEI